MCKWIETKSHNTFCVVFLTKWPNQSEYYLVTPNVFNVLLTLCMMPMDVVYWFIECMIFQPIKNDCKNQPLNLLNTFSDDVIVHSFAILNQQNVN